MCEVPTTATLQQFTAEVLYCCGTRLGHAPLEMTTYCTAHVYDGAHLVLHAGLPGPGLVPGHGGGVWRCGQYPGHCCAAYTATRATLLVPAETRPPWLLWCRTAQLY